MPSGGYRIGAGRKKGFSPIGSIKSLKDMYLDELTAEDRSDPMKFLRFVMVHPFTPPVLAVRCASILMKYLYAPPTAGVEGYEEGLTRQKHEYYKSMVAQQEQALAAMVQGAREAELGLAETLAGLGVLDGALINNCEGGVLSDECREVIKRHGRALTAECNELAERQGVKLASVG